MISENVDVRRRREPRCAKSDNPNRGFPPLARDPSADDDDDDDDVAFRSATENAATETVAIAMDFNTDDPIFALEEDEDDVDSAPLASWSKHASSSMVSSRVLSSFVENRVILFRGPSTILCSMMTISLFSFQNLRGRPHSCSHKSYARTHTLETLLFFFKKSLRERERNKATLF